ncbi:MAG: RNA polymerase sporulation sigma factor SigK [Clostridia bacterium]|nr:RNA polymerase sporulation sigma factor SigK [Clostridia bacterium]MBR0538376.1 RNA polymerase sporulation sigma factor SigK [Clostridia bacterium]
MKNVFSFLHVKLRRLFGKKGKDGENLLFFIGGAPTLPEPLTPQEELIWSMRLTAGDEEAREVLIVRNLRLVVYIAKKFEASGVGIEDLISIGTVGLIKAVKTFCPDKKIKLATYASRCIENEILMYLRKLSNRTGEVSIDEPLNVDWDGNELLLSDLLYTEEDAVSEGLEKEDEIRVLMKCVSTLPQREQQIIRMRFGLSNGREYTQKEVADLLGISQSYISRIEKKIIKRLKDAINREMQYN